MLRPDVLPFPLLVALSGCAAVKDHPAGDSGTGDSVDESDTADSDTADSDPADTDTADTDTAPDSEDSAPCEPTLWYVDADGDGFGDAATVASECVVPDGYVANADDCDDAALAVHPSAVELCNGVDDDCNSVVDDITSGGSTSYPDTDGDGFGDGASPLLACSPPAGYLDDGSDCDDAAADVFPGAVDACGDGLDADCDGRDAPCVGGSHLTSDADATFYGPTPNGQLGWALDGVGDVDGDGLDDILLGAFLDTTAGPYAGMGYVVPAPIDGSTALTAGSGLAGSTGENAGMTVRAAGDMDGDGHLDVLISAYDGAYVAAVAGPITADVDLRADAVIVETTGIYTYFGYSHTVDAGGDVDGDGLADALLGAPGGEPGRCMGLGAAYLLRGPLTADTVEAEAWASFHGGRHDDCTGSSVAVGGDLDGDGLADVVVGAAEDGTAGIRAGAVYVWNDPVAGSHSHTDSPIALTGEVGGDLAGGSAESSGDVDGDGYADLLIGASGASRGGVSAGGAYLVLGPITSSRSLADADTIFVGESVSDCAGMAISNDGGDVDADGRADILVGAPYVTSSASDAGRAYLFMGLPLGVTSLGASDATYDGAASRDLLGFDVSTAGDVTGDGFDDILIGAPGDSSFAWTSGAVYVFAGGRL